RRRPPRPVPAAIERVTGGSGRLLDELDSGTLIERQGIPRAPAVVLDVNAPRVLSLPFPYPVAVKALAPEIAHKTDIGGVMLGVADGAALMDAARQIRTNATQARPVVRLKRVLGQTMLTGVGEALVGYRVDPAVGPLVIVAAGGIFTEIYRDRTIWLARVDVDVACEMIAEVRALQFLAGYRGRPKGDLDALAHAIVVMSEFAQEPAIAEARSVA